MSRGNFMILIVLAAILGGSAGFWAFSSYGILVAIGSAPLTGSLAASFAAAMLFVRRTVQDKQVGSGEDGLKPFHAGSSRA
jgi:hypothetical protein